MKYKTKIEIVTDAADKNEAIEIVGEYLSGNIVHGIDMKCRTKPVHSVNRAALSVVVVSLLLVVGIALTYNAKPTQSFVGIAPGANAVQPPLKTSKAVKANIEFKKQWEKEQTKEALDVIKRLK